MKFYPLLTIGDYHQNYCEDYYLIQELGNQVYVCAVMDGCTMGEDSYFASTLVGKLLRKIIKEYSYQQFHEKSAVSSPEVILQTIVQRLFSELKSIKNQLLLETSELLTTLIILVCDQHADKGMVLAIGDGVVCINGKVTVFEQQNNPDYIAYHLNKPFEEWYACQKQVLTFDSISDISIATDGIETFASITGIPTAESPDIFHSFLIDTTHADRAEMLSIQLRSIEKIYSMKPTDDLAIIRVIN